MVYISSIQVLRYFQNCATAKDHIHPYERDGISKSVLCLNSYLLKVHTVAMLATCTSNRWDKNDKYLALKEIEHIDRTELIQLTSNLQVY
jgi:hypothetical protein